MDRDIQQFVRLIQAVADENRLRILNCLRARPACVCELVQATGLPQSRISRHLKLLRDAGLVVDRRDAQWVEYSLTDGADDPTQAALLALVETGLGEVPDASEDLERLSQASRDTCDV